MGKPASTNFDQLLKSRISDDVLLEDIIPGKSPLQVTCQIQKNKSIYVSSTGDVYPCCFLGFNPQSYGHGNYHQAINSQIRPLISNNNALKYPLADCITWFNQVKNSWKIKNYEKGRLVICDDVCGQKQ
jgi:hypothetical protein